ncbi:MAG: hypothetical protein ABI629_19080 [bacterium]
MRETVDRAFFARIRGEIIDFFRVLDPGDEGRESPRQAIDHLSNAGKIPQTTVRLLQLLLTERNDAEYRARSFEGIEADQIRSAWASVQVWAHSVGIGKVSSPARTQTATKPALVSDRRQQLDAIVAYLNAEKIRATYGAVAELLGILPRSIGQMLGTRRPSVSWIVNAGSSQPTAYEPQEMHPDLERTTAIITTGAELRRRMNAQSAPQ